MTIRETTALDIAETDYIFTFDDLSTVMHTYAKSSLPFFPRPIPRLKNLLATLRTPTAISSKDYKGNTHSRSRI